MILGLLLGHFLQPIFGELDEAEKEICAKLTAVDIFTGNFTAEYNTLVNNDTTKKQDVATFKDASNHRTLLHAAAYFDSTDSAQDLIAHGADVNAQDNLNATPLHYAVGQSAHNMVTFLLSQTDIDATLPDEHGNLPLHDAIIFNKNNIAETLINHLNKSSLNIKNQDRKTPLFLAAQNGNLELVKTLCEKGALDDLDAAQKAAEDGKYEEIVTFLETQKPQEEPLEKQEAAPEEPEVLQEAANVDGNSPLHIAVIDGDTEKVVRLLQPEEPETLAADVNGQNRRGKTPLHLAVLYDRLNIIKILTDNNIDFLIQDNAGQTALHLAAHQGKLAAVVAILDAAHSKQELLESTDEQGNTPLHLAAISGDNTSAIIKRLHQDGADLEVENYEKETPLKRAQKKNNQAAIDTLKELGAQDDQTDEHGNTPLHRAAQQGNVEEVTKLITEGAAVNSKNKVGDTPLHLAATNGHASVIQALAINTQLELQVANAENKTALHLAAQAGKQEAVIKLLELANIKGLVVNELLELKDNRGNTPLHLAAQHGQASAMQTLAQDVTTNLLIGNQEGKTPLHLAAQANMLASVNKLLELAARNDLVKNLLEALDNNSKTPLDLATKQDVIDALENARKGLDEKVPDTPDVPAATEPAESDADRQAREREAREREEQERKAQREREKKKALMAAIKKYKQEHEKKLATKFNTPLHIAVIDQELDEVKKLLNEGENINSQNREDKTPLHLAAERRSIEIIKILASDKNCNLLAVDNQGQTALHLAALYGEPEAINALLLYAKSKKILAELVSAKDKKGDTALDYAQHSRSKNIDEIIELLIKKGATGKTKLALSRTTNNHLSPLNKR